MRKIILVVFVFAFGTLPLSAIAGSNAGNPAYPPVEGVMGVIPAVENSCAAIWLAIPQGQALAGIEWFNNDGTLPFPGLYLESGVPENPVSLEQTLLVAENVSGESAGWSTIEFSEPVTCASEGLYLIFRYPAGVEVTAYGAGGGPGIGYVADGAGAPGWLCSDGQSWDKVGGDFGFAVLPVLVAGSEGMIQLNGSSGQVEPVPETVPLVTALHPAFPNPFNPETEISFSLSQAQDVELRVFDVRGHMVATLARGYHQAGKHALTWRGVDSGGRRVASGVYFVRFKAGSVIVNQRLVLVK